METRDSGAFESYAQAFRERDAPFLTWHELTPTGMRPLHLSRGEFLELARRAAQVLGAYGVGKGDRVVHGFGQNHYLDLVFRLAASWLGAVPVTINWEADTAERVCYKLQHTAARLLIHDARFAEAYLAPIAAALPELPRLDLERPLSAWPPIATDPEDLSDQDEKIVIFTSGTTGQPKGVSHDYTSYSANSATFDAFWTLAPNDPITAVVTSALHHANATAISDWCMRRQGARLELLPRYTTGYWSTLCDIAETTAGLVVAPLVSRHFDFLAELEERGQLPVPRERLGAALAKVQILIGSAPVGPTTVRRIRAYAGRLPVVRFGSSETCLQVMGIPPSMPDQARQAAFERGWADANRCGYYIGRAHEGHTEVRIVAAIEPDQAGFMQDVPLGQPGYLVTRGANLFCGYVGEPEETAKVLHQGWYLGLRDIGFCLSNPEDGGRDFYWMSRHSTLLIKGGANYAYDQIDAELNLFLRERLGLGASEAEVAVVGMRLGSEHEDQTCATVWLQEDKPELRAAVERLLLGPEARALTKGARPDRLHFGEIARNFKGAVLVEDLKQAFMDGGGP